MSRNLALLMLSVLAVWQTGCTQKGPKFDLRAAAQGIAASNSVVFTSIQTTNRLQPDWLVPSTNYYRLGPSDMIEVEIQGEGDGKAPALVGPDGKIYVGILPAVFVWGLTLEETENALKKEFSRYQKSEPVISVSLRTASFQRYWVMGSVLGPGVFPLTTPTSLLEAIARSNGFMSQSGSKEPAVDLKGSFVMRRGERLPVDMDALFNRGDLSQNIYLQQDDYVYIKSSAARQIYVMGAVGQPAVLPYDPQMTLLSSIVAAGGPREYAYLSHVTVVRGSLNSPRAAVVDYGDIQRGKTTDIPLEPNDLIFVPYAPYKKLAEFVERIIGQFASTVAVNEGRNAVIQGSSPAQISLPLSLPPPVVPQVPRP